MKYIATREGVEVLTGKGPATEKQKEMVAKLLKDFPDVRDSFEYEDYKQAPTLHTASALISAALDSHMQNLQSENGYLKYIATRPGAEKHGAHGLFGREENTDLTAAMHDLTAHDGNVWTIIYSLHREDAERLGYNNAAAWRKLLVSQQNKFAEAFHVPVDSLPDTHKAGWMATAATSSSEQGMASVMSTVLSRLNSFIDSEQEQVLCYDSPIDAEHFASEKCAIFLIIPEEDPTKHFMAGLMIQNLSRELFSIADANEGKLKKRVVFYCDEFGTMPPFDVLPLFSAGRSRKLTLVPIIQSLAQLEKNYGKEGAEIIADNCQDTIFGGFAPNSQTAETLSKALGSRTVLTGSISKGKDSNSQSLQMAERALLSPDELKSLPKGEFVVMKTGMHPMRTKLQLYFKWGISFEEAYQVPERAQREVYYAGKEELLMNIKKSLYAQRRPPATPKAEDYMSSYAEK